MPRRNSPHRCHYCLRQLEPRSYWLSKTKDHVVPASQGGRYRVVACLACNAIKGSMSILEWSDFMAAHPGWWKLVHHTTLRGADLLTRVSPAEIDHMIRQEKHG